MTGKGFKKTNRKLQKGETLRNDGRYQYRWVGDDGKRHSIYSTNLDELRKREKEIQRSIDDGINISGSQMSMDDLYLLWKKVHISPRDSSMTNYELVYKNHIKPVFGKRKIVTIKPTDVMSFHNELYLKKNLKYSTIKGVNNVLNQMLAVAVRDNLLRTNPATGALTDLKKRIGMKDEPRKALSVQEQKVFFEHMAEHAVFHHWIPLFTVLITTGMRIGELLALRWENIDFENNVIHVENTMVGLYTGEGEERQWGYQLHDPKTKTSARTIPMQAVTLQAFLTEKERQKQLGLECIQEIDGYRDFIFLTRRGTVQSNSNVNTAIKRIACAANKEHGMEVLSTDISCHTFRHTFATRLLESNVNIKVLQTIMGHSDISITMNTYTDVKEEYMDLVMKDFERTEQGTAFRKLTPFLTPVVQQTV